MQLMIEVQLAGRQQVLRYLDGGLGMHAAGHRPVHMEQNSYQDASPQKQAQGTVSCHVDVDYRMPTT